MLSNSTALLRGCRVPGWLCRGSGSGGERVPTGTYGCILKRTSPQTHIITYQKHALCQNVTHSQGPALPPATGPATFAIASAIAIAKCKCINKNHVDKNLYTTTIRNVSLLQFCGVVWSSNPDRRHRPQGLYNICTYIYMYI